LRRRERRDMVHWHPPSEEAPVTRRPLATALAAWLLGVASPAGGAAPPAAPSAAARPASQPTGLAAFTALPRFTGASISPKGTTLAAISLEKGRRTLHLVNLATRKVASVRPGGESMIGAVHWANDDRLVAELAIQDGELAVPQPTGEIYAVNADGTGGERIFGYRAGRKGEVAGKTVRAHREYAGGSVVSRLPGDDHRVLIEAADFGDTDKHLVRVFKLDVYTGATTYVTQGPVSGLSYLADQDGEVRLATTIDAKAKRAAYYRDPEKGWLELSKQPGFGPHPEPIWFNAQERAVEVVEAAGKGFGIFSVSLDSGERKLLVRTETAEPGGTLRDRRTGRLLAVTSDPDLPVAEWLDQARPLGQVVAGLAEAYPGQHLWPVSRTDDERLAVVAVYSDRSPMQWLLVDVEKRSAEPLLQSRPWINPEEMAETAAFHIAASDGLRIHGFLTSPGAAPDAAPPPLVVLPHGGPHGPRDHWGFNPEVQLLASQGFAVLQVNFRGSGGYGDDFMERGYGRWGDRMMQDVIDATRWALKKGKADPARVCIYGGSFGGYTALQAPIVAPGLFRCAVGFAGVYDLTLMTSRGDISWSSLSRGVVQTYLGGDEASQKAASPLYNVEKLDLPILLIHGEKDVRVPIVHAERLRDALTKLGRPPGWLVEPNEGHGFYDEGARERMYRRLVDFLKEHTRRAGT
jgi:dipeptidyl aminopeptidase/acylaminoacyl peptidase